MTHSPVTTCPDCGGKITSSRINLEEFIYLCKNKKCVFPFNTEDINAFIFKVSYEVLGGTASSTATSPTSTAATTKKKRKHEDATSTTTTTPVPNNITPNTTLSVAATTTTTTSSTKKTVPTPSNKAQIPITQNNNSTSSNPTKRPRQDDSVVGNMGLPHSNNFQNSTKHPEQKDVSTTANDAFNIFFNGESCLHSSSNKFKSTAISRSTVPTVQHKTPAATNANEEPLLLSPSILSFGLGFPDDPDSTFELPNLQFADDMLPPTTEELDQIIGITHISSMADNNNNNNSNNNAASSTPTLLPTNIALDSMSIDAFLNLLQSGTTSAAASAITMQQSTSAPTAGFA